MIAKQYKLLKFWSQARMFIYRSKLNSSVRGDSVHQPDYVRRPRGRGYDRKTFFFVTRKKNLVEIPYIYYRNLPQVTEKKRSHYENTAKIVGLYSSTTTLVKTR